jgi:hypothetical protein
MGKIEDQHLPSYDHVPTTQAAKRNKRLWIFALLAGVLVVTVNLSGGLKGTSWKPHRGCGKGRLHTKPRSHYTLPSGDEIPSVALGEAALSSYSADHLADTLQGSGRPTEEKSAKQLRRP